MISRHPVDFAERISAVTTFDGNVVVIAGAGTGKTALLIAKITLFLLGESYRLDPSKTPSKRVEEVLALTFTDKAAAEMGERLLSFLRALSEAEEPGETDGAVHDLIAAPLLDVYGVSWADIRQRARSMLEYVDRVETLTIHSFCASLLRSHPIEAGLSPEFEIDTDGQLVEEHVEAMWEEYGRRNLGRESGLPRPWKAVFDGGVSLHELHALVLAMVNSPVPIESLLDSRSVVGDPESLRRSLRDSLSQLRDLGSQISSLGLPKGHNISKFADLLPSWSNRLADVNSVGLSPDEEGELLFLLKKGSEGLLSATAKKKFGATLEAVGPALDKACRLLLDVVCFKPEELLAVHTICSPIVELARASLKKAGIVPYDHLLLYASELLSKHPEVARVLANRYDLVLVDEVQDTDPIQYDIIKPLTGFSHKAEQRDGYSSKGSGPGSSHWGEKGIFVVGDPKQSIYLFRSADIEVFHREVESLRERSASVLNIRANFRSNPGIIRSANAVASRLFEDGNHPISIQPQYVPVSPPYGDEEVLPCVHLVEYSIPKIGGRRVTADDIADEEATQITACLSDLQSQGVEWGDIAIIFPTRTGIDSLTIALQEAAIPSVLSGSKSFYQCQEVLDTSNLLSALIDPWDKGVVLAFLGSTLGGTTNNSLYRLSQNGICVDWTYADVATASAPEEHSALSGIEEPEKTHLLRLFHVMTRLHGLIHEVEAWEALFEMRSALPVVEAWSTHPFSKLKMANVERVFEKVENEVVKGSSLAGAIRRVAGEAAQAGEAEESQLASPNLDAVRLETIHGAKGLEYEVVFLVNLFRQRRSNPEESIYVKMDRGADRLALRIGRLRNQHALQYFERYKSKERAERARLLYVAMTRAKERLIIFAPGKGDESSGKRKSKTYAEMITSALDDAVREGELVPGVEFKKSASAGDAGKRANWVKRPTEITPMAIERISKEIEDRKQSLELLAAASSRITPSSADEPYPRRAIPDEEAVEPVVRDRALRFGDLCHISLEHLDFARPVEDIDRVLASPLVRRLCGELYEELLPEAREVLLKAVQATFFQEKILKADLVLRELSVLENVDGATLSGRIDLAARKGEKWIVVDFKTDRRIAPQDELLARYGGQKAAYVRALKRALNLQEDPAFYLYFLRFSEAISL